MCERILITGGKGGVGKSTVCVLLAMAFAHFGKRTLVLETGQRSLDVLLGADNVVFDLADALVGNCTPEQAIQKAWDVGYVCAPIGSGIAPDEGALEDFLDAVETRYDYILMEAPGDGAYLPDLVSVADRAVIVSTADRASARGGREVSDYLAKQGVADIRLCVNKLPPDFVRTRPIPDLDWLIDTVCAQLIGVVPFEPALLSGVLVGSQMKLARGLAIIFDNLAQRIMGKYIDLWVW